MCYFELPKKQVLGSLVGEWGIRGEIQQTAPPVQPMKSDSELTISWVAEMSNLHLPSSPDDVLASATYVSHS